MLTRMIPLLAAATLLTACATAPRDMPRASPPAHAAGQGLGLPAGAASASTAQHQH